MSMLTPIRADEGPVSFRRFAMSAPTLCQKVFVLPNDINARMISTPMISAVDINDIKLTAMIPGSFRLRSA
jgi:hypothetical protein